MSIPPPIETIEKIVATLNSEGKGIWVPIDGYYALGAAEVTGKNVINSTPKSLIVLKAFLNQNTLEIRTYVAKYLNINPLDRENLFP